MMASKGTPKRPVVEEVVLRPRTFAPYVEHLATLLRATACDGADARKAELASALDGQPGRQLRKLYTIDALRETGTYFTGSALANRLVTALASVLPSAERVVDPACGAGDLLVACARHLPLKADVSETLREWGKRLTGFDINSAFVEATRYRLALLALERTQIPPREIRNALPLEKIFSNIQLRSGSSAWQIQDSLAVIVVNPPFAYGVAERNCTWANGRVSQAATFMDTCLSNAARGTRILAILPDVLRTGSRYEKWRQMITAKATVHSVEIVGQFDELTEISVFLLDSLIKEPAISTLTVAPRPEQRKPYRHEFGMHRL
jgi:N-6 DNA Methylase